MENIVIVGNSLIEIFLCTYFPYLWINGKEWNVSLQKKILPVFVAACAVLFVIWRKQEVYFSIETYMIEISAVLFCLILFFKNCRILLCGISCFVFGILSMIDYSIAFLVITYKSSEILGNISNVNDIPIILFVLKLVLIVVIGFGKIEKQIHNLQSNRRMVWGLNVIEFVIIWYFQTQLKNDEMRSIVTNGICLLFLAVCIFAVGIVSVIFFHERDYAHYMSARNEQLERNYEHIYQNQKEVSRISHDFKNHMNLIVEYLEAGEIEKALSYSRKIRKPLCEQEHKVWSGDKTIDIILNDKILLAKQRNIDVQLEIQKVGKIGITDYDICVIFANLLDNAIEACTKIEGGKRWICIVLEKRGPILHLQIENNIDKSEYSQIEKQKSSKHDGMPHGIGMESVEITVKKYEGQFKVKCENDKFQATVSILLDF